MTNSSLHKLTVRFGLFFFLLQNMFAFVLLLITNITPMDILGIGICLQRLMEDSRIML